MDTCQFHTQNSKYNYLQQQFYIQIINTFKGFHTQVSDPCFGSSDQCIQDPIGILFTYFYT